MIRYNFQRQITRAIIKDIEPRAKLDDYELEDNYDFSDGIR